MRIKEDFLLREIAGCYVVVPVGKNAVDFNGIVNLNGTGAFLWQKLETDTSKEELLSAMLEEYDVPKEMAEVDINNFIKKLEENNLLA